MSTTTSDRPTLAAHRKRLQEVLTDAQARLDRARREYEILAEAGEDVGAGEDEGGSEADQTLVERDRLRAAIRSDEEAIAEVSSALERAGTKAWSRCTTCGNEIGKARLEALPTTEVCVTCKAARSW